MNTGRVVSILILVVLAAGVCCEKAVEAPPEITDGLLPFCWGINDTYHATPDDLDRMSSEFGARVASIDNVKINAAGIPLQVNVVVCPSRKEAQKTYDHFLSTGLPKHKFVLSDDRVYEFMCQNRHVAAKMKDLLGLLDKPVRKWRVKMEVAPLDRSQDDTKWNHLYNAAVAHRRNPDDQAVVFKIRDLSPSFDFGNTLTLRAERPAWGAPEYQFTPEPKEQKLVRDLLRVTFDDLPVVADVPRITINALVTTQSFANYEPEAVDKYACVRRTDPWPMAHDDVRKAMTQSVNRDWSKRKNMESMLCWVYHNIEYRGEERGSRYGTLQVLRQRYGHCWDKTDVFISMCRLVELPARQVYGWVIGLGGHVWAQVYFDDEGWISVDPTCSWVGVTEDYIPLFISEDGHPPFVYTAVPETTPID